MSKMKKKSDGRKQREFFDVFTFSMLEQDSERARRLFASAITKVTSELESMLKKYYQLQRDIRRCRRNLDLREIKLRTIHELIQETEYIIERGEDIINKFSLLSLDNLDTKEKEPAFISLQLDRWRQRVREYNTSKKLDAALLSSQKEIAEKQKELSELQAKIRALEYLEKLGSSLDDKPIEHVHAIIRQIIRPVTSKEEFIASQEDIFDDEKSEEETI